MNFNPYPNFFNPYMPTSYPVPQFGAQVPQQPQGQPQSAVIWCQGIEGAKAAYVEPGRSSLIMDSEAPVFYLKNVDASGIPAPLRIFDYTERPAGNPAQNPVNTAAAPAFNPADYVSRKEFELWKAQFAPKQEGGI